MVTPGDGVSLLDVSGDGSHSISGGKCSNAE
jgi:hypothetical protein